MKKFNGIDITKFLMSFAVIAIHTQPIQERENIIYSLIISMAVPLFFLASGFLLAIKLEKNKNEEDCKEIIKMKLKKTIKMYIIWNIIYFPLAIYGYALNGDTILKAIILYIRDFFLVGEHYNSWQLWYLLSTIYALIIILLFYNKKVPLKSIIIIALFLSTISFGIDALVKYTGELSNFLQLLKIIMNYSISDGRILRGCIFIPLGMLIANKKIPNILFWIMALIGFLLNCITENSFISSYLLLITCFGILGIVKSIKLKDSFIYMILRNMSTIIYLIHMYIWTIYYLIRYGDKTYGVDCFFITSFFSCTISLTYIWIKKMKNKEILNKRRRI